MCEAFAKAMKSEFEMSMLGEMNFFLGLQVKQLKDGIFINQAKYYKELLKKFDMDQCKAINTPISTSCQLDQDCAGKSVDQSKYRGLIGSLLYLTASRPDIMFDVCLCARYQSDPKESHYNAAKRILKYLQGTKDVGLWYPNNVSLNLTGFSDSDFECCKVDRKSTSGTCHMIGSSLISWHCKKQACVALSTVEAEYIAAGSCCAQTLWLRITIVTRKEKQLPFSLSLTIDYFYGY
ncbi:secreted RxLR effector protein 161-like [Phaseolus vulgaris]|uniref:secreted RxLR effector protein 161-like n=1 Tax=Phaseolus vulgaris TaxID=3885 RepID=UPI0035CBF8AC